MPRCYWKDCASEPTAFLAHAFASDGRVWYCAEHDPAKPKGWRCSCTAYVVPGEEHRCFYRDALKLMERIAKALESQEAKL